MTEKAMEYEPTTEDVLIDGDLDDEGKAPTNNGKGGSSRPKAPETPIEELYDLSKPIPKADRPDKAGHDAALAAWQEALDSLKAARTALQAEIDAHMNPTSTTAGGGGKSLADVRLEFNQLKNNKAALLEQKKTLRAQLDQTKTASDKISKEKKDTKSNLKFSTLEEIEKEMAKLKHKQETTTMSLNEEKRLIKDMDALQASKKHVVDLKHKDAAMDDVKEQRKSVQAQIVLKDKEVDEVTKQMDQIMKTIKSMQDGESTKRDAIKDLFTKRDDLKTQINAKLKERDALRDDFRQKQNVWYNYQRAVRAQKKMQYEADKKRRDEERQAYLAKLEEEEAKKIPYEEEQALCDYLADYLERTYISKSTADEDGTGKKADFVAVQDDPFAGFKPMNKKDEDEYFGKGKQKKKRERVSKKQDTTAGPFTLSVDTFEQFGLIQLTPPTSLEQVENSVKELRAKKEWYKEQPRGSVPTAKEIRKASEKATRQEQSNEQGNGARAAKPKNHFSLDKEEFVPLGAGGGGSNANPSASWGKSAGGSGTSDVAPGF